MIVMHHQPTTSWIVRHVLMVVVGLGLHSGPTLAEMIEIPAGTVQPLYLDSTTNVKGQATAEESSEIAVAAFAMDRYPVTNAEFLQFTAQHPQWRRSAVPSLFSDDNYLTHWAGDSSLGPTSPPLSPVVNVSWFAAKRYCESRGATLPTVAQWEYVGAASATERSAVDDPEYLQTILGWYQRPTPAVLPSATDAPINAFGVNALHGLIWEWTLDFNTALVTGESRGDTGLDRQLYCAGGSVGASDFRNYAAFMRYAMRGSLNGRYSVGSLGFRCVRNQQEEQS